mgnify:CR=1 FL=1
MLTLTIEDKNDIVSEQIEAAQQETKDVWRILFSQFWILLSLWKSAVRGEEKIRSLKDSLQELENQIADIKRDTHTFHRNVVNGLDDRPCTNEQTSHRAIKSNSWIRGFVKYIRSLGSLQIVSMHGQLKPRRFLWESPINETSFTNWRS